MNRTTNLPTHKVYAVAKNGTGIGAVWNHTDGVGFSMKLDYLQLNGAEFFIRKPRASEG